MAQRHGPKAVRSLVPHETRRVTEETKGETRRGVAGHYDAMGMQEGGLRASDVFGVAREVPLNYVTRKSVDDELVDALTRDKHIVIHGSSKQGKTSLRKYNLGDDEYIVVSCQRAWTLGQLHAAILKSIGFSVEVSNTMTISGSRKVTANFAARVVGKLFGMGGDASVGVTGEAQKGRQEQVVSESLEMDPDDPNDIIKALRAVGFSGYIVLEDFHYLSLETQESFAIALKTFHESSKHIFLVVGVWLDENRLVQHNGDLTGRVSTVNADKWSRHELRQVVRAGEKLLNISFDDLFVEQLIGACFDSVWVVQEACYQACVAAGVLVAQEVQLTGVAAGVDVDEHIAAVVQGQSARYNGFLEHFPEGFQATKLDMYRWLLYPVITTPTSQLERGLHFSTLKSVIGSQHPGAFYDMSLRNALSRVSDLQTEKKIKPPILDYDGSSRKLTIVDRSFLIWLEHQDVDDLKESLGFTDA